MTFLSHLDQLFAGHGRVAFVCLKLGTGEAHGVVGADDSPQAVRTKHHELVFGLQRLSAHVGLCAKPCRLAPECVVKVAEGACDLEKAAQAVANHCTALCESARTLGLIFEAVVLCDGDRLSTPAQHCAAVAEPRNMQAFQLQEHEQHGTAAAAGAAPAAAIPAAAAAPICISAAADGDLVAGALAAGPLLKDEVGLRFSESVTKRCARVAGAEAA